MTLIQQVLPAYAARAGGMRGANIVGPHILQDVAIYKRGTDVCHDMHASAVAIDGVDRADCPSSAHGTGNVEDITIIIPGHHDQVQVVEELASSKRQHGRVHPHEGRLYANAIIGNLAWTRMGISIG